MTPTNPTPPQMPPNYTMQPPYVMAAPDDEIDLLELTDKFLDQWRWWVGGTVIGGLLGLGAAFVVPPKYEAHGVVRVAQVASAVESVPETIVRMQTLAFREEVVERLIKAGQVTPEKKEAWVRALDGKSTFKSVKDAANYVDISLTADSPAQGQAAVSTITQVLKERQQPLMAERLTQVDRSGLRQKVLDLENSKLSPTTKETELVEPIGVSDRPVSPKKSVFTAGGLVLGALLGTLLGFAMPAWWEFQRKRKAAKVNNAGTVA